ncbi:ATP-grasp domain-containing protein [Methanosphaera sp. WGK6]|uniref:ATP-grasp domain-containing protein n=1 Tax=Methanosphaera sp. WGK6 TaxID=1561964 RepID=UPI0013015FEC|nr:ATP-grasp domain-containing protein [Methanosphaera sp. WGK6]
MDFVNEVDYIICTSDVDVSRFPRNKIIGNVDTDFINNKYKLFKLLHKNFLLPDTYKLDTIGEAKEIVKNFPDKEFIVKPIYGTGGMGIGWFNDDMEVNCSFLLQEYIQGSSISSSFLSYSNHDITMVSASDQIIGSNSLGASDFSYCGNITPYVNYNDKLLNISRKISKMCKLVGSNGVDFILNDNKVYVIEVNPRIQGTFECLERSFNMNMAEAHINACKNVPVNIPNVQKFAVKLIPYAIKSGYYGLFNSSYVHDISECNYLFKKGEPLATILTDDRILENAMSRAQQVQKLVYNSYISKKEKS